MHRQGRVRGEATVGVARRPEPAQAHLGLRGAGLVHTFTHSEGATTSDFVRTAILEKIEDTYDLQELREAIAQDSGKRFSIDEVLTELD